MLYTIGYSAYKTEEMMQVLKDNKISCLIDVRSNPFSRYFANFNKEKLDKTCQKNSVIYRNYAVEFGARQTDERYFTDGHIDFEKFTKSDIFLSGAEKILKGIQKGYSFVFMCAEKDPLTCHRAVMVANYFNNVANIPVSHLLFNNGIHSIETHKKLENRILAKYNKQTQIQVRQASLLFCDEKIITLSEAYRLQNAEIGYKKMKADSMKQPSDLHNPPLAELVVCSQRDSYPIPAIAVMEVD